MEDFLKDKLKNTYCSEDVEKIISGLKSKKKTCFRVNKLKSNIDEISTFLTEKKISFEPSNVYKEAFFTDEDEKLRELSIYKEGKIYIQSLSSMLPVYVLCAKSGDNVLDMCAAPGGKTTLIQSLANNKVNLTACELHKDRYERLKYNVELQSANVYLLNQNAIDLNDMLKFDKILLDAPCSGSGTIDLSNPKYNFSDDLINKCVKTQKRLIDKASKLLNKDKVLVYSTCSLLKEENEDMVAYAKTKGFTEEKSIVILPDDKLEGFFVSRLIKK